MERVTIVLDPAVPAPDPSGPPDSSLASLRRRAWAKSRESTWQETLKAEAPSPQGAQPSCGGTNGDSQRPSEEAGLTPNKITSWLDQCRTPLAVSLDDQSASPSKGVLRNGCSFEDDLSLGAEADHLQSGNKKTGSCAGLAANQKRSQFKEKGRSMNSTGSGKSSTVSSSGLSGRFRQIEALTNVANTFIQLYGHVSGQQVRSFSSRDQGGDVDGRADSAKEESPSPLKKRNPALNAAKLLKKTLSKHHLLTASSESSGSGASSQATDRSQPDPSLANGHPAQDSAAEHDHHSDAAGQKHARKKDSCSLETVAEEAGGDGEETERLKDDSNPGPGGEHQPDSHPASRTEDKQTAGEDEKKVTSVADRAPPTLAPPQLLHLRTEKTDSFDMEEIQSNEGDTLLTRTSMVSDLLRTASQHSDSSGFAEEPSVDSGNLKVQESSDSCDSETTVTSHPSQDVSTPVALDQPSFLLPDRHTEEAEPDSAIEAAGSSQEADECDGNSEPVPQYTAHQLPKDCPLDDTQYAGQGGNNLEPEPSPEQEDSAVSTGPSFSLPAPNSPVLGALSRAKQRLGDKCLALNRRRQRGGLPLQRSSSLPTSLLSPAKVVSSVKIEFGRGQTSFSQPRYAFRYIQEPPSDAASSTCISTLLINHSSKSSDQSGLLTEDSAPTRHVHSSCSLRCASPQLDWPDRGGASPWITQSVPDLSSNQEQFGVAPDQSRQSFSPGPVMFISPSPSPTPNPRYVAPLSAPPVNSFLYPTPFHPYASLPNLQHHLYSSMPSLHPQPSVATPPQHANLPLPAMATPPHYTSLWNLHPGAPTMHHFHPNSHPLYHSAPHTPPYLGFHGYDINQDHSLRRGSAPPGPGLGPHPVFSPGSSQVLSSTEMQLRRVLHDIRGTVQRLNQDHTSDLSNEHTASCQQSLAELQQKRRSLSLFRTQMMDLELSIIRQQAAVYKHLSPGDRLEVEQLQSLRSAVRDELLELEQQLEDKVMELTQHGPSKGLHGNSSIDNLCTTSALRAMEPVSDLLREQRLLQSQLSYEDDDDTASALTSSPPTSHARSQGADQPPGVFRASINITPAPPPRPNRQGVVEEGSEAPRGEEEEESGPEGLKGETLQDLIREIRESVAQEVRREIYNELMAAISPRRSPM
ncbi:protein ITPRID2 [Entelurus aequoreus]|uniref:protein ITPRID2 n=1 Tax=Entelurus aequoreus TaxID=161455 RepID=UPI002B1E70B2|nr:protein ITPRID2 [Entelurus aequoreus]